MRPGETGFLISVVRISLVCEFINFIGELMEREPSAKCFRSLKDKFESGILLGNSV